MLSRYRLSALCAVLALAGSLVVAPPAGAALTFTGRFGIPSPTFTAAEGGLNFPYDIAVHPENGDIFVVDRAAFLIQKYDSKGEFLQTIGKPATGESYLDDGELYYPASIALNSTGSLLYVADTFNSRIQAFESLDGRFAFKWGTEGNGNDQLNHPNGIALDTENNVYVADARNHRVMKFTYSGAFIKSWGALGSSGQPVPGTADGQFNVPVGIDVDGENGRVYVTEDVGRFQSFDLNGGHLATYGEDTTLSNPDEIAVDPSSGFVYVIESGGEGDGHEVSVFDTTAPADAAFAGEFKGTAYPGTDYGFSPHGITFDPRTDELMVTAPGNTNWKIYRYATQAKPELSVDFDAQAQDGKKLVFEVRHNMVLGSCSVQAKGELRTPQSNDLFDGDESSLGTTHAFVPAKTLKQLKVPLSQREIKAIRETKATIDFTFSVPEGCKTIIPGVKKVEPERLVFKL